MDLLGSASQLQWPQALLMLRWKKAKGSDRQSCDLTGKSLQIGLTNSCTVNLKVYKSREAKTEQVIPRNGATKKLAIGLDHQGFGKL